MKKWIFLFFIFLASTAVVFAQSETKNSSGRKETKLEIVQAPPGPPSGFIDRNIYYFESGVMAVARTTTGMAGTLVDRIVQGTAKTGEFLFAPLIRTLDFKK